MQTLIRRGTGADAPTGIALLRRSITELCHADHHGDAAVLRGWLASKTEASWNVWAERADATLLVAERGTALVGVGMVDAQGGILLNYVHPMARFTGVSSALLDRLETVARDGGLPTCVLESTETARAFYASRGYRPVIGDGAFLGKDLV